MSTMISEKENVFSNLLLTFQNNASRNERGDTAAVKVTYALLGDKGCGKKAIVDALCVQGQPTSSASSIEPSYNILSYRSVDVSDDMIQGTSMNVWTLHDYTFEQVFNIISDSYSTDKIGFLIALDLSKEDDCVKSLKGWLSRVSSIRKRIPSAQSTPIIVIGCKSDSIVTTDTLIVRKAKEIQGEVRAICILCNASLIYTSATKGTNIEKLRNLMVNQVYKSRASSVSASSLDKEIEDGIDNCLVTQGLDSAELIRISTGCTFDMNQEVLLQEDPADNIETSRDASTKAAAAAGTLSNLGGEDEDEWLAGLQSFIKQVGAASNSGSTNNSGVGNISASVVPMATPAIASSNSTGDLTAAATKPLTSKRVTRKTTAASEEKQDASDFFKSLLAAPKK